MWEQNMIKKKNSTKLYLLPSYEIRPTIQRNILLSHLNVNIIHQVKFRTTTVIYYIH